MKHIKTTLYIVNMSYLKYKKKAKIFEKFWKSEEKNNCTIRCYVHIMCTGIFVYLATDGQK